MSNTRGLRPFSLAVLIAAATTLPGAQSGETVTVSLSDPNRPATVEVDTQNAGIVVRGENRTDVLVTSHGGSDNRRSRGRGNAETDRAAGLRQLTRNAGLTITEENNVIEIQTGLRSGGEIEIRVPLKSYLSIGGNYGSGISVVNVEGNIEVEHQNGAIRLTNVAGTVVAEAHNRDVTVVLNRIAAEKAMSFVSFNGSVDVTLPSSAKANLRMRSDNGDVFTDFDVQARQGSVSPAPRRGRGIQIEVNESIVGSINGGGPEFELRTFNGNVYLRRATP